MTKKYTFVVGLTERDQVGLSGLFIRVSSVGLDVDRVLDQRTCIRLQRGQLRVSSAGQCARPPASQVWRLPAHLGRGLGCVRHTENSSLPRVSCLEVEYAIRVTRKYSLPSYWDNRAHMKGPSSPRCFTKHPPVLVKPSQCPVLQHS